MLKFTTLLIVLACSCLSTLASFPHGSPFAAPALAYSFSPAPATFLKYANPYAAPAPVVRYSLGAPVTTTTTTYAGFAAPPHLSPHLYATSSYQAAALPASLYAAPQLPLPYGRFSLHAPSYAPASLDIRSYAPAPAAAIATYAAPPAAGPPLPYAGW